MVVLQATVPLLAMHDPETGVPTLEACRRQALRLINRLPLLVSAWERLRTGQEVVAARTDLSHAANFLYTMHGEVPDQKRAAIMDTILILHADHSFNASTFTTRQIASTRAHLYAAIAGAVGSLSGELHGGASEPVFRMLQQIGTVDRVREYVTRVIDNGERIMGMGHAVYQVTDPRAASLAGAPTISKSVSAAPMPNPPSTGPRPSIPDATADWKDAPGSRSTNDSSQHGIKEKIHGHQAVLYHLLS